MSSSREDYDERLEETHGRKLATAVLLLYIDSCKQYQSYVDNLKSICRAIIKN